MKLLKKSLYNTLRALSTFTDPKSAILACVDIEKSNGDILLTATDLTTTASVRLATAESSSEALQCCVNAKMLTASVKPTGKADGLTLVELRHDSNILMVRTEHGCTTLPTIPAGDYPVLPIPDYPGMSLPWHPTDLAWVAQAASSDESRQYLTVVCVRPECIVATDGHRLHKATFETLLPHKMPEALIPALVIHKLVKIMPASTCVRWSWSPDGVSYAEFSWPSWTITTRLLDTQFPDYTTVIPSENQSRLTITLDTAPLAAALAAMPSHGTVTFEINSEIKLTQIDPSLDLTTIRTVPTRSSTHKARTPSFVIGFNGDYWLDAIKDSPIVIAGFNTTKGLSPVRIDSATDGPYPGRTAVIMPCRE